MPKPSPAADVQTPDDLAERDAAVVSGSRLLNKLAVFLNVVGCVCALSAALVLFSLAGSEARTGVIAFLNLLMCTILFLIGGVALRFLAAVGMVVHDISKR